MVHLSFTIQKTPPTHRFWGLNGFYSVGLEHLFKASQQRCATHPQYHLSSFLIMATMSLRTLTEDAGLSLQEILNVSQDEFKGWSTVACKRDIISRAEVYREWRMLRNEATRAAISSLRTLCDEAGLPMQEVLALSKNDFRHLTRVMQVDSITQHTLLYQEKSRILDTLRGNDSDVTAAAEHAGHLLVNIAKKAGAAWGHCEPSVHEQQYLADVRNDIDCREHAVSNATIVGEQGLCDERQDEASLINKAVSDQDENSLLNDVLMSSHNIDPNGSGQLSLEFVWQLANTQKQAVEHIPGNEVIFSGALEDWNFSGAPRLALVDTSSLSSLLGPCSSSRAKATERPWLGFLR